MKKGSLLKPSLLILVTTIVIVIIKLIISYADFIKALL